MSFAGTLSTDPTNYEALKAEAEKLFVRGSYAGAYELYQRADAMDLPPAEARWVDFRLADALWRSQAATETPDPTHFEQARQQLEALIREIERSEDRDRVWVEAQESLGDFWWARRDARNWGQAWPHYQQALDWWAGSAEIELARQRYLHLVWSMAEPPQVEPYYTYGTHGNQLPVEILENALQIAQEENDQAHAHYLIAMTLRQQGDVSQRQRVPEEFEAALPAGKKTDWYDDALYHYAEWMAASGRVIELEDGQWRQEPDYLKALELFRRLVREFEKGETRYYDSATSQIENITKPVVGVSVSHIFLPDSEIQFHLNWRNAKRIEFVLYQVDLTRDLDFSGEDSGDVNDWINRIRLADRTKVKVWSKDTGDQGDHKPGQETIRLENKLPLGAYLIEATGGGARGRDLILVSDASLVLKSSGKQALVYFCDALHGSPLPNARVKLWQPIYRNNKWSVRVETKPTNPDGIAIFDLIRPEGYHGIFVSAALNSRQAFSPGTAYGYSRQDEPWRIYAFTDRPAYRPGETAQWKLLARRYNGSVYSTPVQQTILFEITDPRGSKVKDGKLTLNAFGSAWDSLPLDESMPLGEYRVAFWEADHSRSIGSAVLFRLEEYKLPEFKVAIQTPEEKGKKKSFRLGEKVEVTIQADYYFGGAVANATVEAFVYQNPFYHWWHPAPDYPWFYEDMLPRYWDYGRGQGQLIKRETLKTDAAGKVTLVFDTPRNAQQDFEYRVEARVTDASRREIIGTGTVRVTRQRYYVYPRAEHNLYRPQDKVTIDIKALDPNNQPVEATGTVKLTRDTWYEIWLDPDGKEVQGPELERLERKMRIFPPPPQKPGEKPWQLKFRGYEHDDILIRTLKTNAEGEAEFSFTPERQGYYRIAWSSREKGSAPIQAETTVWVTTRATTELGYRHGGVEIIVDKDTFRAGERAPVLLTVPTNDRYVLFSIEGEDLYSYQLVHLTGTVKLLELPIEEKHVPNIFLSAALVSDRQLFLDTKQVVVPPVEQFLTVEVKSDREQYQPREEGTLTITTRDHSGKPVSAEVALGLVDESVYYIQQDYAGDPRQFYFGRKRQQHIQTQSTFHQKSYAKLVEGKDKYLIDERESMLGEEFRSGDRSDYAYNAQVVSGVAAGRGGGYGGGVFRMADAAAPMAKSVGRLEAAEGAPAEPPPGEQPAVQVRTDFRATVFWQPNVVTDKTGTAVLKVTYPDSLTTWKANARVATAGSQFGMASTSTRTQKPLIVRLQAPRFFVVGDLVTISAVINNNTDAEMLVTPALRAQGVVVTGLIRNGKPIKGEAGPTKVGAHGEARVDWLVSVQHPGEARLQVEGRSPKHADAMEKVYVAYEHGIEKFVAKSGKVRGEDVTIRLEIPRERKTESTTLTVQVTPSLAVTLLDALPYLIDYPYGCTEQTMSRFLPAAIVAKSLKDLGLEPDAVTGKLFGGIVPEHAAKTHPNGKKDLRKLEEMIQQGLKRLYDFQHSDGGWGWWKEGESDHFMTAYVVWGLTLGRDAGLDINEGVLARGVDYLDKELVEEESNYDLQAWMLHALSAYHASEKRAVGRFQTKAFDNLWANRDRLNAYTRALLALSAHQFGFSDKAKTLVENLENGVKIDRTPDTSVILRGKQESHEAVQATAHWGEDSIYWRWSEGSVEATAFALRALLAIDPENKLVEPVTNWLIKNRRGAQWSSTRDTAISVLALNDYLHRSGELETELEYELHVNAHLIATRKLTPADVLSAPSQYAIDRSFIRDGSNEIRIRRKGARGSIYFAVQAKFFSLEEPITAAGNEIFVRRQYVKLVGRPTLLKGYVYDKELLNDGESVRSGERVEVIVTIDAKNNYEYLVFEDLKPAGLEAVELRSGTPLYAQELKSGAVERQFGNRHQSSGIAWLPAGAGASDYTGRSRWVYQELRDRKLALFIDKLPQGVWEIRYQLRAEVPGQFHALPLLGYAMYVPEIRSNDTEVRLRVEEGQ